MMPDLFCFNLTHLHLFIKEAIRDHHVETKITRSRVSGADWNLKKYTF